MSQLEKKNAININPTSWLLQWVETTNLVVKYCHAVLENLLLQRF